MIMSDLERVKERVRKLLNLAANDGAADGEIDNAMRSARQLMESHHLSEDDLATEPAEQFADIESAPKDRSYASVGRNSYRWEASLSSFVKDFVGGVGCYIDTSLVVQRDHRGIVMDGGKAGKRFCFYGIAEDAAMAASLFAELRMTIATAAKLKFGGCYKGDGGAYAEGFVDGLRTKIRAQKQAERITATGTGTGLLVIERREDLIQRKSDAAAAWIKGQVRLKTGRCGNGANGSWNARSEGRRDGESSNVSAARVRKIC